MGRGEVEQRFKDARLDFGSEDAKFWEVDEDELHDYEVIGRERKRLSWMTSRLSARREEALKVRLLLAYL